jgi:hypothetical protein
MLFSPEEQYELYLAIRDGNITQVELIFQKKNKNIIEVINNRPFDGLWHEPGPEATCLHLAVCCLQVDLVEWLLRHGADPNILANGCKPLEMIEAYDLFAPVRALRPQDIAKIKLLLRNYS